MNRSELTQTAHITSPCRMMHHRLQKFSGHVDCLPEGYLCTFRVLFSPFLQRINVSLSNSARSIKFPIRTPAKLTISEKVSQLFAPILLRYWPSALESKSTDLIATKSITGQTVSLNSNCHSLTNMVWPARVPFAL